MSNRSGALPEAALAEKYSAKTGKSPTMASRLRPVKHSSSSARKPRARPCSRMRIIRRLTAVPMNYTISPISGRGENGNAASPMSANEPTSSGADKSSIVASLAGTA